MNITIEARALGLTSGGTKTYTYQLIKNLLELNSPHLFNLIYTRAPSQKEFIGAKEHYLPLSNNLFLPWWLNRQLPALLRNIPTDVVHFTKAVTPRRKSLPTVVTIYDLIPIYFPASQKFLNRHIWPRLLAHAAKTSDAIITISSSSKHDIMNYFSIPADKITVTPLAINTAVFHPTTQLPSRNPYILYVGTIEPRKNLPCLIRAFSRISSQIPHRLIIAGRPYLGQRSLVSAINASPARDRITYQNFVSPDSLPALYAKADLFVWPSVYEGWGLPPQEAMACGTPVLVSNGGSLPEVVGDAGRIVSFTLPCAQRLNDQDFENNLASAMLDILTNEPLKQKMRAAGLERIKSFTWQQVARDTLKVYESLKL